MWRLQENAVSDMQLITMMLTTAIKISTWNNLPVEKSLIRKAAGLDLANLTCC